MPDLPATRRRSWEFYAALQADCLTGSRRWTWHEAERWLGRNDLFYLLVRLLRRPDINRDWLFERCREVQAEPDGCLDLWAREHGKDLAIDTPVLTANRGWATHGDLAPGDLVFAPDGEAVEVLRVTEHFQNNKCYLMTFSDGARIVAGAGHLWRIRQKIKRRVPGTWRRGHYRHLDFVPVIMTTEQMAQKGGRLDVGVCAALDYSDAALPLDPYVLGVWLGDGTASGPRVTAGLTDADEMMGLLVAAGAQVSRVRHSNAETLRLGSGVRGNRASSDIANVLRRLNVMDNKHIPLAYMRASVWQRMALLQGLMDTDGYCDKRGTASFSQANLRLADQVYDLAASLGLRPRIARRVGKYKGGNVFWLVSFQAHTDRNPFRMGRKVVRAIPPSYYRGVRTVAKIEPMPSVPTNCITVEGGMYCVGRELIPTHNSSLITFGLTVMDILRDPEITVGIFSHTRPIAKAFLRQIKVEFEGNDWLKHLYPDVLWDAPHKQSPKWSEDDGIIVRRNGNPKEATVEAWGLVDGQPTGRHFRLRVYDDVVTRESVTTSEQIEKTTKAWELSDNLGVQIDQGGASRHIGTRYSLADTYAAMIERGAVKPRVYPATHNGTFDGRPVLFSAAEWKRRLTTQSRATVAAQLLQNPMADEAAMFRVEWLRPYEVRPRTLNVYIMCDPSRGRSATSDNTAISVVGVSSAGAKFLLDGVCHRMTLSQRWIALRNLWRKWKRAPGVQHIAAGYERYGAQSDDEYFAEQMERDRRNKVPDSHFLIQELNWPREGGDSKKERVERLEPDFRNGRFFLPREVWREGAPMVWTLAPVCPECRGMKCAPTDPDDHESDYRCAGCDARFIHHPDEIKWRPSVGLTSAQMQAVEGGSEDLISKSIRCVDQERHVYDLTLSFVEEYKTFPFGARKDLVDATSRIYDMDARGPVVMPAGALEPAEYPDR